MDFKMYKQFMAMNIHLLILHDGLTKMLYVFHNNKEKYYHKLFIYFKLKKVIIIKLDIATKNYFPSVQMKHQNLKILNYSSYF